MIRFRVYNMGNYWSWTLFSKKSNRSPVKYLDYGKGNNEGEARQQAAEAMKRVIGDHTPYQLSEVPTKS